MIIEMVNYTLRYFGVRARGEIARLLFNVAGKLFVNEIIELKDWKNEKPSMMKLLQSFSSFLDLKFSNCKDLVPIKMNFRL